MGQGGRLHLSFAHSALRELYQQLIDLDERNGLAAFGEAVHLLVNLATAPHRRDPGDPDKVARDHDGRPIVESIKLPSGYTRRLLCGTRAWQLRRDLLIQLEVLTDAGPDPDDPTGRSHIYEPSLAFVQNAQPKRGQTFTALDRAGVAAVASRLTEASPRTAAAALGLAVLLTLECDQDGVIADSTAGIARMLGHGDDERRARRLLETLTDADVAARDRTPTNHLDLDTAAWVLTARDEMEGREWDPAEPSASPTTSHSPSGEQSAAPGSPVSASPSVSHAPPTIMHSPPPTDSHVPLETGLRDAPPHVGATPSVPVSYDERTSRGSSTNRWKPGPSTRNVRYAIESRRWHPTIWTNIQPLLTERARRRDPGNAWSALSVAINQGRDLYHRWSRNEPISDHDLDTLDAFTRLCRRLEQLDRCSCLTRDQVIAQLRDDYVLDDDVEARTRRILAETWKRLDALAERGSGCPEWLRPLDHHPPAHQAEGDTRSTVDDAVAAVIDRQPTVNVDRDQLEHAARRAIGQFARRPQLWKRLADMLKVDSIDLADPDERQQVTDRLVAGGWSMVRPLGNLADQLAARFPVTPSTQDAQHEDD